MPNLDSPHKLSTVPHRTMVFGLNSQWTAERDAKLAQLIKDRFSSAEAALALETSRGSVIGRADRLNLIWFACRGRKPKAPRSPPKPRAASPLMETPVRKKLAGACAPKVHIDVSKKPLPKRFNGLFDGNGISFLDRPPKGCHWPLDRRNNDGMPLCCGEESLGGKSYCSFHYHLSSTGKPKHNDSDIA